MLPLNLLLGQQTGSLLGFFSAVQDSTLSSLANPEISSADCVVSMPYQSVRKEEEYNRKYYARNSEQLKARGISVYEEDPGKKKAAAASGPQKNHVC